MGRGVGVFEDAVALILAEQRRDIGRVARMNCFHELRWHGSIHRKNQYMDAGWQLAAGAA